MMPRPLTHRSNHSRYSLDADQHQMVADVADGLPAKMRHYFFLHVASCLELSREQNGNVSNQKVAAAINTALREIKVVG